MFDPPGRRRRPDGEAKRAREVGTIEKTWASGRRAEGVREGGGNGMVCS